ncbi:MAG TPA: hypothetical protein VFH51_12920, partial [Myxococcota bacterium]|nr:hypothetical protein [Myxococcota bacterium]
RTAAGRAAGIAAAVAVVGALACLGWPSLGVPLDYTGDTLSMLSVLETLQEQLWYWESPRLGVPGTQDLLSFPMTDNGHFALCKLLVTVGLSPVQAFNLYYLLTFAAVAATGAWVLGVLGISAPLAVFGGAAYALLPYHFLRLQHLFLAAYYMVPLAVLVLLRWNEPRLHRRTRGLGIAFCFLLPAFGAYYAFFFCYLLSAAMVLELAVSRDWRVILRAGVLLVATVAGLLVNEAPSLVHGWGATDKAQLVRPVQDTEVYGLKLIQLLLPAQGHQSPLLAGVTKAYTTTAPLVNENQTTSLGLVLSLALLATWLVPLASCWRQDTPHTERDTRLRRLMALSLLAFVFGTIGGFSSVFGYFVVPFIRSSNRICVYIAFFAVVGGATLAQGIGDGLRRNARAQALAPVLLAVLALVWLWDTLDVAYLPNRAKDVAMYESDAAFFADLERDLPAGARIFQLPYLPYPEGGIQTRDYYPLRPHINTRQLGWSFGGMRGTRPDGWYRQTATTLQSSPADFVRVLRRDSFAGVLVQRSLYGETLALEQVLAQALGGPTRESPNHEFVFFPLR